MTATLLFRWLAPNLRTQTKRAIAAQDDSRNNQGDRCRKVQVEQCLALCGKSTTSA